MHSTWNMLFCWALATLFVALEFLKNKRNEHADSNIVYTNGESYIARLPVPKFFCGVDCVSGFASPMMVLCLGIR